MVVSAAVIVVRKHYNLLISRQFMSIVYVHDHHLIIVILLFR